MNKDKIDWYNNPSVVTNCIIGLIVLIIILSQSFAVNNNLSTISILRDIVNHNMNYILVLIYFVMLKTSVGKKYFNYLNVFIVFLYLVFTFTSFLSVFQSFDVTSLISLFIKVILLIYLFHSLFKDTTYWKEYNLKKSAFNEFSNDNYFSSLLFLSCILLAINLIFVKTIDGAILSITDCIYVVLFSRYIYLYSEYVDVKNMILITSDKKQEEK